MILCRFLGNPGTIFSVILSEYPQFSIMTPLEVRCRDAVVDDEAHQHSHAGPEYGGQQEEILSARVLVAAP